MSTSDPSSETSHGTDSTYYQIAAAPTLQGLISSSLDALVCIELVRNGILKPFTGHPTTAGGHAHIYVQQEGKRWRDGRKWSQGKLNGSFVVYNSIPSGLIRRSFHVTLNGEEWNVVAYEMVERQGQGTRVAKDDRWKPWISKAVESCKGVEYRNSPLNQSASMSPTSTISPREDVNVMFPKGFTIPLSPPTELDDKPMGDVDLSLFPPFDLGEERIDVVIPLAFKSEGNSWGDDLLATNAIAAQAVMYAKAKKSGSNSTNRNS